jgi:molecular chaperone IbpA
MTTRITSLDLQPFYRQSIGLDKVFDRFISQIDNSQPSGYPPYNIIKTGEETSLVQVAVAGFTEGELTVEVRDNTLILGGEKSSAEQSDSWEYTHQGISNRRFVRTFPLADYVEVLGATVENGILTVELERKVPDTMKPKTIDITYKK